jgi:type IV secretory pathway VirD2 relaxase
MDEHLVSADDDLPIFRPRMGSARRGSGTNATPTLRNAVLAAGRRFTGQSTSRSKAPARVLVSSPTAQSRRVVVKVHVARMTRSGPRAAGLHLRYIQRDGVERDGSSGVLYGAEGPESAPEFEATRAGEKHQFRIIVAPEDGEKLDLTDYVRRFMQRVEQDAGRKLEWAAVNHYDTEHPHAHIVVRGVDRDGYQVRFDRHYVSHGLRERAQELATLELGPRREHEIQRVQRHEITQERFTSLDRDLERRSRDGALVLNSRENARPIPATVLVARLRHLERMGLARKGHGAAWTLVPNWQRDLRELGMRGDILKQMHRDLKGDPSRYRILDRASADDAGAVDRIAGRVAAKGLSDELKGTGYAIVETVDRRAYHVQVDAKAFENIRVGDAVSVSAEVGRRFTLRRQDDERERKRRQGLDRG